ncbi:hypothetical protein [Streptomyces sp. NBC_00878]|nr:hypothetical protein [Streptomyces sp. NBC_00878]MCX4909699.1 hypothetical protein [Streptomyces sp. NBC_00878]
MVRVVLPVAVPGVIAVAIVPCVVNYLLLQKYYVGGLLSGALKYAAHLQ